MTGRNYNRQDIPAAAHAANAIARAEARASAPEPTKKGHRKAVFPMPEGDATFTFPERMTPDGIEELEAYLEVLLRIEKRKAKSHSKKSIRTPE